ncbi:hypothetical protein VTI28DRAFT_9646 [Corynascus sepedonium]
MLKSELLLRRQRPLTLSLWSPTQYTVVHLVARSERALSVSIACGVLNPGDTPQRTLAITEHDRVPTSGRLGEALACTVTILVALMARHAKPSSVGTV